jgi:urease accessory protein UreF
MNAELAAAGEVRIVIPTIYRANYIAALRGASQTGHYAALYAALAFARRYSAQVDFSTRESAEADLTRTNALRESAEAEAAGIRLVLRLEAEVIEALERVTGEGILGSRRIWVRRL